MFRSNRLTGVFILVTVTVTVFSCLIKSTWCATLVISDNPKNINGNENVPINLQTVSSSYSMTPSYAYQFYTNDNEHLDKLLDAHQSHPSLIDLSANPTERRMDEAHTDLPMARSSDSGAYKGFDFSAWNYQQGWKSKEMPDFLSATSKGGISQENDYLSQEGLQRDYSTRGKSGSSEGEIQGVQVHKPITIIKSEEIRASNSSVYSGEGRLPTGTPITYQGHQKMHTAASYSSPVLPRKVEGVGGGGGRTDDKSTFAFASGRKRPVEKRKILQSRQDTVEIVADDAGAPGAPGDSGAGAGGLGGVGGGGIGYEAEEEDDHVHYYDHDGDDHYGHSHGHGLGQGMGAPGQSESYDHDHDEQEDMTNDGDNGYGYYGDNGGNGVANGGGDLVEQQYDNDPAIRDFGQGGGGGGPFVGGGDHDHVPVGVGAGFPGPPGLPPPGFPGGPLPPPPVPLKGSIDYILIPLILIGLAGPIFVVLYVILGGFEYRLTPIVRRSLETSYLDYEPYINSVTSSVGRALDKYECVDYATCRLRTFLGNQVNLDNATTTNIETVLSSITPKNYKSSVNSVFGYLKRPEGGKAEDCKKYKCAALADKLPI